MRTPPQLFHSMDLVIAERLRQHELWGEQNHEIPYWVVILMEEVGELCEAYLNFKNTQTPSLGCDERVREEAVQVAAVALQIVECLERHKKPHEQTNT